jgi:short-subunit dehydrogenase
VQRTWLITGAASGLGRELAAQLARRSERLVLWDRDGERLERTAALLGRAVVHTEVVDVVNADATRHSAERTMDAAGLLWRVIHCAGILRVGPALTMSATDYRATIEVNYLGTVHVSRALAPALLESARRLGTTELVLIASFAAVRGVPSMAGYSASKHAVLGFAQALRDELAGQPLRVRVVCPPAIATPMLMNLPELPPVFTLSPPQPVDRVAREILAGLDKTRWLVLPDRTSKLLAFAQRAVPGIVDLVLRRVAK